MLSGCTGAVPVTQNTPHQRPAAAHIFHHRGTRTVRQSRDEYPPHALTMPMRVRRTALTVAFAPSATDPLFPQEAIQAPAHHAVAFGAERAFCADVRHECCEPVSRRRWRRRAPATSRGHECRRHEPPAPQGALVAPRAASRAVAPRGVPPSSGDHERVCRNYTRRSLSARPARPSPPLGPCTSSGRRSWWAESASSSLRSRTEARSL